jgi:tetratricopeptide (TPR) repeat protein
MALAIPLKEEEDPMISFFRRPMLAALFVAAVTSVTVIAFEPLYAQYGQTAQAGKAAKGKQAKQDPATTARREVGTPINDALKLVESKKWDEAMAKVQLADAVKDKTPYEEFMVAKYIAYIAVNREPQDIATATAAVNRQIASNGAPEAEKAGMYTMAMLLNYTAMDYAKVIQNAEQLKALNQPFNEQQNLVLVQSYYNTMDYANAAKIAKEASDQKPSADVLGLLLNSQAKMKDDAGYRVTLDKLATVSAQPEVWGQVMDFALDGVSKGPADGQEHRLLNLFRLAALAGTIRKEDYSVMVTIDLQNGLPNEAKEMIAKGGVTGDLVNQTNSMAANDQGSLQGLAAEASKQTNGEIDVKLGESYMTYGRYDEAVNSLRAGIQKGGLKDLADAQTTLGIALYRAGKKDEALAEFRKAEMGSIPASGVVAHVWALFLQRPAA